MKKPVKVEFSGNSTKDDKRNSRRRFIKLGGLAFAGSSFLMYSCSDDDDLPGPKPPEPGDDVFDLGAGNLGVLNYAYALEQLETAFYKEVREGGYYAGADDNEKQIMDDLYYHESIHSAFFKTAITAAVGEGNEEKVLPDLEFDFSSVNFDDRMTVLETSLLLEDTGVSAFNGARKLIDVDAELGGTYLLIAGKIVSVEARHASAIADLIEPNTTAFARDEVLVDVGDSGKAYDKATPPADVLAAVIKTGFVKSEFTAKELPTE